MSVNWSTVAATTASLVALLNHFHIRKLHIIVNSRLSELLVQKGIASHAAGKAEGIAEKNFVKGKDTQ